MTFSQPRPIASGDPLSAFCCGTASLDNWLRQNARENERRGASRTFISLDSEGAVAAYYSLSAFTVERAELGNDWGRLPRVVPVTLIGRLAVHLDHQGKGLGFAMLQDAVARAITAAKAVGSAAVVAHVVDPKARPFYERFGFTNLAGDEKTYLISMADIAATLESLEP